MRREAIEAAKAKLRSAWNRNIIPLEYERHPGECMIFAALIEAGLAPLPRGSTSYLRAEKNLREFASLARAFTLNHPDVMEGLFRSGMLHLSLTPPVVQSDLQKLVSAEGEVVPDRIKVKVGLCVGVALNDFVFQTVEQACNYLDTAVTSG